MDANYLPTNMLCMSSLSCSNPQSQKVKIPVLCLSQEKTLKHMEITEEDNETYVQWGLCKAFTDTLT